MRRVGVPEHDWGAVMSLLADCDVLRVSGVWSHFACADEPAHASVGRQSALFCAGVEQPRARGLSPHLVHLCNSAGTLTRPGDHHDLVRCGIALYGLDRGACWASCPCVPPCAWCRTCRWSSAWRPGEAVSYGHVWSAPRDTTVVTVPAGHADGVTRSLGGRGEVVLGRQRRPIVGRVTMEQFLVVACDADMAVDDEVVLIGRRATPP